MAALPQESKSTTLADLRGTQQPREASMPNVRAGFSDLAGFELAQRAAKALAASSLVPQNYQGNLADCIVALELAQRIGASPLMVMQNLYIVHGRPAWSSQFLIAAVNQCGRYTALQYEWTGAPNTDAWTCRAFTKDKATGERVQGPSVSIAMAKKEGWYSKNGSKWQSIPELMLMYRAATFFARTNAPELTMGLNSQEEAHEIIDVAETTPGRFEANVTELKAAEAAATAPTPQTASEPAAGAPPVEITLETVLAYIAKATTEDQADIALDMGQGKLDKKAWAKAAEARNARVEAINASAGATTGQ